MSTESFWRMWGDHLDISRSLALIADHDLPEAIGRMGAAMHLLQRDLTLNCTEIARIESAISSDQAPQLDAPRATSARVHVLNVD